ncbi:hypothetical protein [Streptomyces sp. NPDC001787]|uniref:hypothetical protein n=1 Tax=Streptomyces sp. NPDC001787 TaxID=3154523 RepID=UPI003321B4CA
MDDADPVDVVDVVAQQGVRHRGAQLGVDADRDDRTVQAVRLGRRQLRQLAQRGLDQDDLGPARRVPRQDTRLLTGEALQVGVAGFLAQHVLLRGRACCGRRCPPAPRLVVMAAVLSRSRYAWARLTENSTPQNDAQSS